MTDMTTEQQQIHPTNQNLPPKRCLKRHCVKTEARSFERRTWYKVVGFEMLAILGTPLVGRLGYFRMIRYNLVWKIVGGLTMYFLIGPDSPWLIMLYIPIDSGIANATFSIFNMPLSDIADADKAKYCRSHPISSTVFGSNALVVKPALPLSPMLVVNILNRYGYEHLKDQDSASPVERAGMQTVMFQLICFFPVLLGLLQLIVWSNFTIRRRITETTVKEESYV